MLLDSVQYDDVAVQLIAALLVHEAAEVLRLAELRRTLGQMPEESLIRLIEALKNFLHGLAVKQPAADATSEMLLHCIQTDEAFEQPVVPLLQC